MNKYSWGDKPGGSAYLIEKAGFPFIFIAGFSTFVFALSGLTFLAVLGLMITLFICFFFRDPDRIVPNKERAVITPADGKVIITDVVEDCPFIEGQCLKVSIFMSLFNVHVNRISYEGTIKEIRYFPGKFFNANFDKASKENEHNAIIVETESGFTYCMVQIAGLVARRIICRIQEGDNVTRGSRFGLICFGSRLDVYLPPDTNLNVSVGDKVKAGTTILGYLQK